MKEYEAVFDTKLINNLPVIIRLDGRAFHTFTKGLNKPFDDNFNEIMQKIMKFLCENIPNCVFGYTQSDEITLVLYDNSGECKPWFDNRLEKITSVSASMATLAFNKYLIENNNITHLFDKKLFIATFDSRAFNVPPHEVVNNIIWRQQDATKNSINSVAQSYFTHKELQGKNVSDMQDMLMLQKNINWNNTPTKYKRGVAWYRTLTNVETSHGIVKRYKWIIDEEMPIISKNREFFSEKTNINK